MQGRLSENYDKHLDYFVAMDLDRATLREMADRGVPKEMSVLLRFEPDVVCPLNYRASAVRKFGRVLDIGRPSPLPGDWEFWPQNWPDPERAESLRNSYREETRLVLMNANKLSLIKNEQYSFRRKLIHSFPLDVYGPDWDSNVLRRLRVLAGELIIALANKRLPQAKSVSFWFANHTHLRGTAIDKLATLARYKFAVIVENSPDYMSEKLFDALFARCIPIYFGPSIEHFSIPKQLAVAAGGDVLSFQNALNQAQDIDYELWQQQLDEFLHNEETVGRWSALKVFKRLVDAIEE